jgi:ATP-dependent RNA helicase DDX24/MAK5
MADDLDDLLHTLLPADEIPELPAERSLLEQLRRRIALAREVETANHKMKKKNHEKNWLKEAAEAMDIQMDTDESDADDGEGPSRSTKHQGSAKFDPKIAKAKAELNALLKQPILVRGISHRYITSGSRRVVDDIIAGNREASLHHLAPVLARSLAAPRIADRCIDPPSPPSTLRCSAFPILPPPGMRSATRSGRPRRRRRLKSPYSTDD